MVINNKFNIGDEVYLKTDTDQKGRIVTGLYVRELSISYLLSHETTESSHYDFEITSDRDVLKATSN